MSNLRYNRDDFNDLIDCIIRDKDYGGLYLVLRPTLDDGSTYLRLMFLENWEGWKVGQIVFDSCCIDNGEEYDPLLTHEVISRRITA